MPLEIEIKVPVDCRKFDYVLKQIGYKRPRIRGTVFEEDHYFSHPCRDFSITDETLRIRYSIDDNGSIISRTITYKGPRLAAQDNIKVREEIEVKVDGDIKSLIEKLGFKEIAVIKKRRTYIEVDDFLVTFDKVEDLGCFVEIESTGHPDPHYLAETVFEGGYKTIRETYLEMYLKKKKEKEIFEGI